MKKYVILIISVIILITVLFVLNNIIKNRSVTIFLADEGTGKLKGLRLKVSSTISGEEKIVFIIGKLKAGSEEEGLIATVPEGSELLDVKFERNIAHLYFNSKFQENHPGGSTGEILTIYSVVNSVVKSLQGVDYVKFYVEGKELDTLKGHIDLRYPLSFRKY